MGGGGKEIKAAAAEGCKSMLGKSRGAAGRDGCGGERCPRRAGPCCSALPVLLSALAAASCVYLGVRTSDLQARLAAIEGARGGSAAAAPLPPLPGFSLERLNEMMQEKVERLLAQVCGMGGRSGCVRVGRGGDRGARGAARGGHRGAGTKGIARRAQRVFSTRPRVSGRCRGAGLRSKINEVPGRVEW